VDLSIAAENDPDRFIHFNDFFIRQLRSDARTIDQAPDSIVSPVDGMISQIGAIEHDRVVQAKGEYFSLSTLLGGDEALALNFTDGEFSTLYLSPRDYHRIHMPVDGRLKKMIYVPGKLFAVNQRTVRHVPNLFARNERVITLFETQAGPMALIMVGAIFVGSMETVWHERTITPPYGKAIQTWDYDGDLLLKKGEEMGRFNMGSTVILLFGKDRVHLDDQRFAGKPVQMGQAIGKITD